ncbi:MAG: UPF0280 family protein [Candidatus Bathyarchaeota archaeon]|nr:UPF0280 family protein [Candidatus Bathyarchaeota archaeon]
MSTEGSTLNQVTTGLTRHPYSIGETRGVIITDKPETIESALDCIREQRRQLFEYILMDHQFEYSLTPVTVDDAPIVAQVMAQASTRAHVGPMASVAGVIADLAVDAMVREGATVAVIENGGEAALYSDRPLTISVGAGDNPLSERLGFRVTSFPCGIATSSGRHSHAFSMGDADSVTVFAVNAGLADAVATYAANQVKGIEGADVFAGVEAVLQIKGVHGVLAIRDDHVATGGVLPEIVSVEATH